MALPVGLVGWPLQYCKDGRVAVIATLHSWNFKKTFYVVDCGVVDCGGVHHFPLEFLIENWWC